MEHGAGEARSEIQERVAKTLGHAWKESSIAIALACSLRPHIRDDVLHFMLPEHVAKLAKQHGDNLLLKIDEWNDLFGKDGVFCHSTRRRRAASDGATRVAHELAAFSPLYSSSLRCTLEEAKVSDLQKHSEVLCATHVALHSQQCEAKLQALFGTLVRADCRRVEELAGELDYGSVDHLTMANLLVELERAVSM